MKKEIKAFDSYEVFKIIIFFRSQGYTIHNLDNHSIVLKKILPQGQFDEEKDNGSIVYINQKEKTAEKYGFTYLYKIQQSTNFKEYNKPFTKKELKLLDTYDYVLSKEHTIDTKQNVYDWVDNNEI
jgi:hypothetical protein